MSKIFKPQVLPQVQFPNFVDTGAVIEPPLKDIISMADNVQNRELKKEQIFAQKQANQLNLLKTFSESGSQLMGTTGYTSPLAEKYGQQYEEAAASIHSKLEMDDIRGASQDFFKYKAQLSNDPEYRKALQYEKKANEFFSKMPTDVNQFLVNQFTEEIMTGDQMATLDKFDYNKLRGTDITKVASDALGDSKEWTTKTINQPDPNDINSDPDKKDMLDVTYKILPNINNILKRLQTALATEPNAMNILFARYPNLANELEDINAAKRGEFTENDKTLIDELLTNIVVSNYPTNQTLYSLPTGVVDKEGNQEYEYGYVIKSEPSKKTAFDKVIKEQQVEEARLGIEEKRLRLQKLSLEIKEKIASDNANPNNSKKGSNTDHPGAIDLYNTANFTTTRISLFKPSTYETNLKLYNDAKNQNSDIKLNIEQNYTKQKNEETGETRYINKDNEVDDTDKVLNLLEQQKSNQLIIDRYETYQANQREKIRKSLGNAELTDREKQKIQELDSANENIVTINETIVENFNNKEYLSTTLFDSSLDEHLKTIISPKVGNVGLLPYSLDQLRNNKDIILKEEMSNDILDIFDKIGADGKVIDRVSNKGGKYVPNLLMYAHLVNLHKEGKIKDLQGELENLSKVSIKVKDFADNYLKELYPNAYELYLDGTLKTSDVYNTYMANGGYENYLLANQEKKLTDETFKETILNNTNVDVEQFIYIPNSLTPSNSTANPELNVARGILKEYTGDAQKIASNNMTVFTHDGIPFNEHTDKDKFKGIKAEGFTIHDGKVKVVASVYTDLQYDEAEDKLINTERTKIRGSWVKQPDSQYVLIDLNPANSESILTATLGGEGIIGMSITEKLDEILDLDVNNKLPINDLYEIQLDKEVYVSKNDDGTYHLFTSDNLRNPIKSNMPKEHLAKFITTALMNNVRRQAEQVDFTTEFFLFAENAEGASLNNILSTENGFQFKSPHFKTLVEQYYTNKGETVTYDDFKKKPAREQREFFENYLLSVHNPEVKKIDEDFNSPSISYQKGNKKETINIQTQQELSYALWLYGAPDLRAVLRGTLPSSQTLTSYKEKYVNPNNPFQGRYSDTRTADFSIKISELNVDDNQKNKIAANLIHNSFVNAIDRARQGTNSLGYNGKTHKVKGNDNTIRTYAYDYENQSFKLDDLKEENSDLNFSYQQNSMDPTLNLNIKSSITELIKLFPGIEISSATRNLEHGEEKGKKTNGAHTIGAAIDISKKGTSPATWNKLMEYINVYKGQTFNSNIQAELDKLGIARILYGDSKHRDHIHIQFKL